jgi:hypothetical protein
MRRPCGRWLQGQDGGSLYRSLKDKHDPDFKKRISDEAVQYVLPTLLMAAYPCKNLPN